MQYQILKTPIEYLKGVGPSRGDLLRKELGIFTYEDLMRHYPFRYVDRSKFYGLREITQDTADIQIKGVIKRLEEVGKGRVKRLVAHFEDESGKAELIWFQGIRWVKPTLKLNTPYILFGKPNFYNGKISFPHPELELVAEADKSLQTGLQPVYNSTEKLGQKGLHSKGLSKLMITLLPQLKNHIEETITPDLKNKYKLMEKEHAVILTHFPRNLDEMQKARFRLKFEEFFFIQMSLLNQKNVNQYKIRGHSFPVVGALFNSFFSEQLPFELTGAQKRVLKEVRKDVMQGKHMNRLVQGDVGSGKTIVALMCMLMAKDNGFQACMMAPTEILANQHYQGLKEDVGELDVRIEILTGSTKTKQRKTLLEDLKNGEIDIIVGTHALLEDPVVFNKLGLAVIDEQHRFGVAQRSKLWNKGILNEKGNHIPPHILVMTATPIPRTLAMSLYGDLDISVIDELPPGRKPITTLHRFDSNRLRVFGFVKEQIALGRQVYIVYPLIEESKTLDYKNLMDGYESISRAFPLPDYSVSVVHGKMKPVEKDYEMERFKKGETDIMVATTVIEVGVNVPNASVMIIENAEKFGLSQLHQLRGRVGRGAEKSYCILMTGQKLSNEAKVRINTMVKTNDGFEVADADLKLRGPGDLMGTRQSGVLDLKIADLAKDGQILSLARDAAQDTLKKDLRLELPENMVIRKEFLKQNQKNLKWSRIS